METISIEPDNLPESIVLTCAECNRRFVCTNLQDCPDIDTVESVLETRECLCDECEIKQREVYNLSGLPPIHCNTKILGWKQNVE